MVQVKGLIVFRELDIGMHYKCGHGWSFYYRWLLKRFILTCVSIRYVEITLIVSIKTCKEVTQLVSTSDKRSSSGEMKIDLKRVGIYVTCYLWGDMVPPWWQVTFYNEDLSTQWIQCTQAPTEGMETLQNGTSRGISGTHGMPPECVKASMQCGHSQQ